MRGSTVSMVTAGKPGRSRETYKDCIRKYNWDYERITPTQVSDHGKANHESPGVNTHSCEVSDGRLPNCQAMSSKTKFFDVFRSFA